jgi:hypothetical protein
MTSGQTRSRKKVISMRLLTSFFAALVAAVSLGAAAQDVPGRAGRLAHAEGSVSLYMDPDIGWEPAYVNTPITSENSIWTDYDSRAEVRVSGMAIRVDETTQLDFSEVDDDRIEATLVRGSVHVRIRHFGRNDRVVITTPNARYVLLGAGRYRIDADPQRGDSRLAVFEGRAALRTGENRIAIPAGQSVVVWGEDRPAFAMQRVFSTEFDRWANARDSRWVERNATRYVSTYMTGYEDLDQYGEWIQEPDYGPLWIPTRVQRDWVPYRYGHWAWVRPWGWTWIDDQPWGYAPFHYGRWVQVRDRWAWYPGRRVERPVWAPALVAWVGGSNWSLNVRSVSAPVVGWYPLSPFERYQPWYRANTTYVNNVNVNVVFTDRDRAWRYAERQRDYSRYQAATVVQREALSTRRPVQQSIVQVSPDVIRSQPVAQQPTTVLPSRTEFVRGRTAARAAEASAGGATTARAPSGAPASGAAAIARPVAPGTPAPAPALPPPTQRPSFAREQRIATPQAAAPGAAAPPPAPVTRAMPPGQERSRFGPGAAPPAPGTRGAALREGTGSARAARRAPGAARTGTRGARGAATAAAATAATAATATTAAATTAGSRSAGARRPRRAAARATGACDARPAAARAAGALRERAARTCAA